MEISEERLAEIRTEIERLNAAFREIEAEVRGEAKTSESETREIERFRQELGQLNKLLSAARLDGGSPEGAEDASRTGSEGGSLQAEQAKAEQLSQKWSSVLKDVAKQVDGLRKALQVENDPAHLAVREGLATVMTRFPDLDLGKLAVAARSGDQSAYDQVLQQTRAEIGECRNILQTGPILSTIDRNPFRPTTVHKVVRAALDEIEGALFG